MAYLGKTPSQAVRQKYTFTATGNETSISGADDSSNTLSFTDGEYVDVYLNGVLLVAGTDYNTTTANTIGGLSALSASDVVEIVVYDTFSVFGGDVQGDITISNGDLEVLGKGSFTSANPDVDGVHITATTGTNAAAMKFSNTVNGYVGLDNSAGTRIGAPYALSVWNEGAYPVVFGTSNAERMRIDSSGLVGIGTDNPEYAVEIENTSNLDLAVTRTGTGTIRLGYDTVGSYLLDTGNNPLRFYTGGSERMRILSGGGITFNGDTSSTNALNDYEKGTFTPSATWLSGGAVYASYVKVGNLVHFNIYYSNVTVSSTSTTKISGLPFTLQNLAGHYPIVTVGHATAVPNCNSAYIVPNTTNLDLIENGDVIYAIESTGSGKYLMVSGTYIAA